MVKSSKRVVIAGGRGFSDYTRLCSLMNSYPNEIECVVSGGARGGDKLGAKWAKLRNIEVKEFIPDWDGLGKRAGFVRNAEMADYANEDDRGVLVCFWNETSKGTKHMIDYCTKKGMEVHVFKF